MPDPSWLSLLWRSIVPAVQPRRRHSAEVQEAQRPHQDDGAQGALALPLPRRRGHAQAERAHPASMLEPAAQLDVLHQRDVGVAAYRVEVGTANEDGLITGADAA